MQQHLQSLTTIKPLQGPLISRCRLSESCTGKPSWCSILYLSYFIINSHIVLACTPVMMSKRSSCFQKHSDCKCFHDISTACADGCCDLERQKISASVKPLHWSSNPSAPFSSRFLLRRTPRPYGSLYLQIICDVWCTVHFTAEWYDFIFTYFYFEVWTTGRFF